MDSIAQMEQALRTILHERANMLVRETGCIIRQRKLTGASNSALFALSGSVAAHTRLSSLSALLC